MDIKVYPVPASERISVEFGLKNSLPVGTGEILLVDMTGRETSRWINH